MDKMYLGLMEAVLIESHHGGTLSDTGHFFTHVVFESAIHFNFKIVILAPASWQMMVCIKPSCVPLAANMFYIFSFCHSIPMTVEVPCSQVVTFAKKAGTQPSLQDCQTVKPAKTGYPACQRDTSGDCERVIYSSKGLSRKEAINWAERGKATKRRFYRRRETLDVESGRPRIVGRSARCEKWTSDFAKQQGTKGDFQRSVGYLLEIVGEQP